MTNLNKTVVLPLVAFVCLLLKSFGIVDIPEDVQAKIVDWICTGIFGGYTLYGIIKNHKKEVK